MRISIKCKCANNRYQIPSHYMLSYYLLYVITEYITTDR